MLCLRRERTRTRGRTARRRPMADATPGVPCPDEGNSNAPFGPLIEHEHDRDVRLPDGQHQLVREPGSRAQGASQGVST